MSGLHTSAIRLLIGSLAASLTWPASGAAQQPAGFAGFAWGTPLPVMAAALVPRCRWSATMTTLRSNKRIVCTEYHVDGVGPTYLTLDFVDGAFRRYEVAAPRRRAAALRAAAPALLGTPVIPAGAVEVSARAWTVSVEISAEACQPGSICLRVSTY